jgi:predicted metalloprotease with PDZ domain
MLVAFLTDVTMLEHSKGKRSVSDLLGTLFSKHSLSTPPADGNEAVFESMRDSGVGQDFIDRNVTGSGTIVWNNELAAAGIKTPDADTKTGLTVLPKLNGRQKALLDKLGYNNWRKLSSK